MQITNDTRVRAQAIIWLQFGKVFFVATGYIWLTTVVPFENFLHAAAHNIINCADDK